MACLVNPIHFGHSFFTYDLNFNVSLTSLDDFIQLLGENTNWTFVIKNGVFIINKHLSVLLIIINYNNTKNYNNNIYIYSYKCYLTVPIPS